MTDRQEKLDTVHHVVDMASHIKVDPAACASCESRACLYFCPAGCFELEDGQVVFHYEGCLECGTCRVACDSGVVGWTYPQGGCGVWYRRG